MTYEGSIDPDDVVLGVCDIVRGRQLHGRILLRIPLESLETRTEVFQFFTFLRERATAPGTA